MAWKGILPCFCRINNVLSSTNSFKTTLVTQTRGRKQWASNVFRSLYKRRVAQGPEKERHRSEWINWNYDAEIFSFGKRLGEEFQETTLKTAFTDRSYIEQEISRRSELEMSDEELVLHVEDNTSLIEKGDVLARSYIKGYLRHVYPALPEEGICAITNHLMSVETLAYIGQNLGMKDLILCGEFAPTDETISRTLKAVTGGLATDQGEKRAELFVQDFILTELVGKDVMSMWDVVNPMGLLQNVITQQGHGDLESRLLFETGSNTILASFTVGVYSDKHLVGKGFGETLTIAEEMAARDGLRNVFGTTLNQPPLPLGKQGHSLAIDTSKLNISIQDYLHPNQLQ